MKKILSKLFTVFALMLTFVCLNANAIVNNDAELQSKIDTLSTLQMCEPISFVNKSELIGYRLADFNMRASNQRHNVELTKNELMNIMNQINLVRNSSEFSNSDKSMHISKLYQDADRSLYDLDNKTREYLYDVRMTMPTLTYKKFVKEYREYYNALHVTDNWIDVFY